MCLVVFAGSALEDLRFVLVDGGRPGFRPLIGSPIESERSSIRPPREPRATATAT
jgi:hypothetical protein